MKKAFKTSLLLLAALPLTSTYAQSEKDSTLNRTVVVENEYNPHLSGASKINVLPKVEEPAIARKKVTYATDLRPVSAWTYDNMSPINREWTADPAKRGYLRAGYGTFGNVDVKAGYIADFSQKDRLKVNFSMDGWNGKMDNRYQEDWESRLYRTDFRLNYTHDFNKARFELGGGFGSQVLNYLAGKGYTFIDELVDIEVATDKQHHTMGDFHLGLSSTDKDASVQYRLQTGLKYFGIKYPENPSEHAAYVNEDGGKETIIHTEGEIWKRINDNSRFGAQVEMDNLFYSETAAQANYSLITLNPYYALEKDKVHLRIGAHIDLNTMDGPAGGKATKSGPHLAPDVKAEFIPSDDYVLYLQATGGAQLNDFHRLNALSPYFYANVPYYKTHVPINASAGLKASPIDGLWFHLFGGYRVCEEELAPNLRTYRGVSYVDFYQLQGKAETGYVSAELKYEYKDVFSLSLNGTYYNWKTDLDDYKKPRFLISKPELELNFFAEAKVMDGLKVNVGYEYVKRPQEEFFHKETEVSLGNVNNLSIGANYTLLKDLSLFAQVNNVLNKKYYLSTLYPAQKLHALAGITLQF